jgi:hypothetical protein
MARISEKRYLLLVLLLFVNSSVFIVFFFFLQLFQFFVNSKYGADLLGS